jgi:hypothetical protein
MPSSKLNRTDRFDNGDLVVLWVGGDYDYRGISKDDFIKAIAEDLNFGKPVTQYSAPNATGFNVQIDSMVGDVHLILTPEAGYATGTITLPLSPIDKQSVLVNSTQAIAALTVTPQAGNTVFGQPTTLAANGFFTLKFDALLKRWYRVG